ncbi:MAG: hypothetical protein ABR532_08420 [Candidatus Dormibacteria bacterium]
MNGLENLPRLEQERAGRGEQLVSALVTVWGRKLGSHRPVIDVEVVPAMVRSRYTYQGQPLCLAAEPEAGQETSA